MFSTRLRLCLSLQAPQACSMFHPRTGNIAKALPSNRRFVCLKAPGYTTRLAGYVSVPLGIYACKISTSSYYGFYRQHSSPTGTPRRGETPSRHAGSIDYPATTGRHTPQGL